MFELSEEHRMLQDLVAKFIDRDVMPLEKAVLARETSGQKSSLTADEEATLLGKCRELGLWGLDVPEEFGGANLPTVALIGVYEEQGRTCVPFTFPPDSPNLHRSCRCRHSGTGLPAQIAEMDLNPVILHEDGSGLTISDALILPKE